MSTSYQYGGTPAAGGYHYGGPGLGVLGSEVPATGHDGASLQYADISLPAEANDEFRVVLLTTPTLGSLFVYEDSSFEFTGPDGVHTFSYAGYKNGILYGTATVTLTIGEGAAGSFVLDDFVLAGEFSGPPAPEETIGRRIGPRVAIRANGELLVLL